MISLEALWDNDHDWRPVSDFGFMRRRLLAIGAVRAGRLERPEWEWPSAALPRIAESYCPRGTAKPSRIRPGSVGALVITETGLRNRAKKRLNEETGIRGCRMKIRVGYELIATTRTSQSRSAAAFAQRDRSHLPARQLTETACCNYVPVSRRVEPGPGFAAREPPGDSKMRRRDRPRNGAKKRLNASSARKRDRMPPPNPRKCRTFPRERRHSRKNRYAWLGDLDSNQD